MNEPSCPFTKELHRQDLVMRIIENLLQSQWQKERSKVKDWIQERWCMVNKESIVNEKDATNDPVYLSLNCSKNIMEKLESKEYKHAKCFQQSL